jgi:hypothetical protein
MSTAELAEHNYNHLPLTLEDRALMKEMGINPDE